MPTFEISFDWPKVCCTKKCIEKLPAQKSYDLLSTLTYSWGEIHDCTWWSLHMLFDIDPQICCIEGQKLEPDKAHCDICKNHQKSIRIMHHNRAGWWFQFVATCFNLNSSSHKEIRRNGTWRETFSRKLNHARNIHGYWVSDVAQLQSRKFLLKRAKPIQIDTHSHGCSRNKDIM